jgi:hypothetical protein
LLRLLVQQPDWLERARGEIAPDRFTVPSFRRIYEALLALPTGAPVGDALAALDERTRDAWQRLVATAAAAEGLEPDREYAGALDALEEIHAFPEIAAEPDPLEMSRRWRALSPEGQVRFRLYLATTRRPSRGRADPSPKE